MAGVLANITRCATAELSRVGTERPYAQVRRVRCSASRRGCLKSVRLPQPQRAGTVLINRRFRTLLTEDEPSGNRIGNQHASGKARQRLPGVAAGNAGIPRGTGPQVSGRDAVAGNAVQNPVQDPLRTRRADRPNMRGQSLGPHRSNIRPERRVGARLSRVLRTAGNPGYSRAGRRRGRKFMHLPRLA